MNIKIKKQLPNIVTITRLISLIVGFICFILNKYLLSIIFYVYGALSDILDGYLARKYNAYSKFGKYLDATSDKLYILSLIILALINNNYYIIIPTILELIITIINFFNLKKNKKIFIERIGKVKTVVSFPMMIVSVVSTKITKLYYLFFPLLVLSIYFEIQSIFAYINQYNGKSKEVVVNLQGKTFRKKISILAREFIDYIIHPVLKIK